MKPNCLPVRALVLLPLLFGPLSGHAQTKAVAAPAVTSTLDVCQDLTTGSWRYSGVVSIAGKDAKAGTAVEYRIQNSVSKDGYKDVLRLPKVPGTEQGIVDPASGATVFMFSGDAPAFTLGTLRNSSTVQFADKAVTTATGEAYTAQVCGCPVVGCTRTQGYWSNKPGVVWPSPYARNATFFSSGLTWQQLFDSPAGGNAYIILAHQYMAAALTKGTVASMPAGVQSAYFPAAAWFASGVTLASCPQGSSCATQKAWAATLDTYNNGIYPGGPQHCPD